MFTPNFHAKVRCQTSISGRNPMRKKRVAHGGKALKRFAMAPQLKKEGKITPFDITKLAPIGPTIGVQTVSFAYVDVGGTDNLAPGAVSTQTSPLTWPNGAGLAVVMLSGFGAAYVDENDDLTDHHLGDLVVDLYFPDDNTVACDFLLRDQGINEGVNMWSEGVVLYLQAV
jgi:hypothetical protein